jgi:pilus assembly protein CpaC
MGIAMRKWPEFKGFYRGFTLVGLSLFLVISYRCWAAEVETGVSEGQTPKEISLIVGKSVILRNVAPIKRVSLAAPEIADFILLSPTQIYLTGKSPGVTNVTLWDDHRISSVFDLHVAPDVSRLRKTLHEILPDEKNLRVLPAHDSITLSGTVSSAANLSQAMALARAYVPDDKIINLIQVAGVHQVMLEVRVAEMSRSLARRLGVNFAHVTTSGNFAVNKLNSLTDLAQLGEGNLFTPYAPFSTLVTPTINALFRFEIGDDTWTGFVDALKEEGLIKILAEPTLIALSGQTAKFLAGGEYPVPEPQGLGTVAIEYREFGVKLSFTPTVLSDSKINIQVAPEVSDLDFTTAVILEGTVVPGRRIRGASTVIELADGQSFAIAGLLEDNIRTIISKFPLLGDLPVLGVLFRSKEFQRRETELIIIVTPHLVKPLDMERQPLPTDSYIVPDDGEFFLLGLLEGRQKPKSQRSSEETFSPRLFGKSEGFDGEFGHTVP